MQTETRDSTLPRPPGAELGRHEIAIEDLTGIDVMHGVEKLQGVIWGSDPTWVVPSHVLYIAANQGGIVLGARIEEDLVGFVFGLLARHDKRLFHASHMLGILPAFQGHGIGSALKQQQRATALDQGLDLMIWTSDPLEARNSYFNLHKLGAVSRTYRSNYYGAMRDALNQGLPSDRLVMEWALVDSRRTVTYELPVTPVLADIDGRPGLNLDPSALEGALSINVPRDFQAVRSDDSDRAMAWRLSVRRAFTWAFDHGYVARDFRSGAHILFPEAEPAPQSRRLKNIHSQPAVIDRSVRTA